MNTDELLAQMCDYDRMMGVLNSVASQKRIGVAK